MKWYTVHSSVPHDSLACIEP